MVPHGRFLCKRTWNRPSVVPSSELRMRAAQSLGAAHGREQSLRTAAEFPVRLRSSDCAACDERYC
jgi:hypothetical protein